MPVIVETNVAVVANRQNDEVVSSCEEACIKFLIEIIRNHTVILIDEGDEVRGEYTKAIKDSKPFQLGAQFLIYIYQHQYDGSRVQRESLPKNAAGEFADFPNDPALANFDQSDRKFAALARRTGTPMTNATDSDWAQFKGPLAANGINVHFLCGCDPRNWFLADN